MRGSTQRPRSRFTRRALIRAAGATFSSAELNSHSETLSGGAVQIGNAIVEKRVLDAMLQARDRGIYNAVTDCGAGGLSSAVGEMGEELGAEVYLEKVPLKI